jgi:adrenodoxin-NADP+ reductase
MTDAFDTADAIAADWESHCAAITSGASDPDHPAFLNHAEGGSTGLGWSGVRQVAEKSGIRATSWRDWEEIDRVEKERGQAKGKVREKFASVEEMLAVLD